MVLSDMQKGDSAEIVQIHADKALKDRLHSFGVMRGETLFVKGFSLGGKTMEIEVGSTFIALRSDEADKIEITQINNF